jgi:hypothetical protein
MHEAGLALDAANALRERSLVPGLVRLAVRGGHNDHAEFSAEAAR